jgi:uncharacterized membrane protein
MKHEPAEDNRGVVSENVEKIAAVAEQHESRLPRHHGAIATLTTVLGQPILLWAELAAIGLWVIVSTTAHIRGHLPFDPPPFFWLQGFMSTASLLLTTMVLIAQNRQRLLSERRSHLDTQLSLMVEQKVAKLISLVEELRRDLPVPNRRDPTAESMERATDPQDVAAQVDEWLDPTTRRPDKPPR